MEISFDEQLKFINSVRLAITQEAKELIKTSNIDAYKSTETNELNAAISKAQGKYPRIAYNRLSKYFQKEYADLDAILSKVLPVLSEFGLNLTQWTELPNETASGGHTILHTEVSHSSGQWKESRARVIPPKNDPLTFVSTINRIKASQITSLLGITVADDPLDDNAEIQMADDRQMYAKGSQSEVLYNPRDRSTECVSRDQLDMMEKELQSCPDFVEEIFRGAQIESLADLPKNKFDYTITKIRKVKEVRAGKRPTAD